MFRRRAEPALLLSLLGLVLACAHPGPAAPPDSGVAAFSGPRAFEDLEALVALGPRPAGSPAMDATRAHVRAELEALGLAVEKLEAEVEPEGAAPVPITSLRAVIPGESPGVLLLTAPLDTAPMESFEFVGANAGASGAALLLELARALVARPLPYTVWLVFVDGEAIPGAEFVGSRVLATSLRESGELERVRALVVFDRVADRDLAIARDLRSDRALRRAFTGAAEMLGHADAFPREGFALPEAGHLAFRALGFRRFVAVVDDHYGEGEPPGSLWRTAEDTPAHCSPESLETVGTVTLHALHDLALLFRKVDRLAGTPAGPAPDGAGPSAAAPADAGSPD